MNGTFYRYRPWVLLPSKRFVLEGESIIWSQGRHHRRIAFADIVDVVLHKRTTRRTPVSKRHSTWRLRLRCRTGETLVLSSRHCVSAWSWQDRSLQYWSFVNPLLAALSLRHPAVPVATKEHWTFHLQKWAKLTLLSKTSGGLDWAIRRSGRYGLRPTVDLIRWCVRVGGPFLSRHRVARQNLIAAFPEKSKSEIQAILNGMWDNFGRVAGEFLFLDQLWPSGRVTVGEDSLHRLAVVQAEARPCLFFSAHVANWELTAVAAKALGVDYAVIYRQPGILASHILATRTSLMGTLIAADHRAAAGLREALLRGASIGMLVDQHFMRGVDVTFFGRTCKANPALARLARHLDCSIRGVHTIRIDNDRYAVELTEPLLLSRDAEGKVDVISATQAMTSVIESWIRQYPEQWLWMHRRWRA